MVSALPVVEVLVPKVARVDTSGTYVEVRSTTLDLAAVNGTLRDAVLADRGSAHSTPKDAAKQYETFLDPSLVSASTIVVSFLMPSSIRTIPYRPWNHWVSATVHIPTGESVSLEQLFASARGVQVFGNAWRRNLARGRRGCVAADYVGPYSPTADYFRNFALTPDGLAAGVSIDGACSQLLAVVPYSTLRPYLSKLGARLVAGVRPPMGALKYSYCHGGSAAKSPTGRSSRRSGNAIFVGYCRYGKWYISAQIGRRRARRFDLDNAKVNGRSPGGGVEILKVIRLPPSSPVALARVGLGLLNGFDYTLFTAVRGRVVPVTVGKTRTPIVLHTHGSAGWGEGIRCLSQRGRLLIDQYRWDGGDLDAKGRVRVRRWRYTFEPPASVRVRQLKAFRLSYKAVPDLASANCFGVRDHV
jgi:hypothetical protein